jgi:hypothetical protein
VLDSEGRGQILQYPWDHVKTEDFHPYMTRIDVANNQLLVFKVGIWILCPYCVNLELICIDVK